MCLKIDSNFQNKYLRLTLIFILYLKKKPFLILCSCEREVEIATSTNEETVLYENNEESVFDVNQPKKVKRKYTQRRKKTISTEEITSLKLQKNLEKYLVLRGCDLNCKKQCVTFFNEHDRRTINMNYWSTDKQRRQTLVQERVEQTEKKIGLLQAQIHAD